MVGAAFGDGEDVVDFEGDAGADVGRAAADGAALVVALEDAPAEAGLDGGAVAAGRAVGFWDSGEELCARDVAGVVAGELLAGLRHAAPDSLEG